MAVTLVIGLLPLGLAIVAGALAFSGTTFSASWNPSGLPLASSVPASLVVIFWSFLGLESAAALSRLVKDPARDVGRASVGGVGLAFVFGGQPMAHHGLRHLLQHVVALLVDGVPGQHKRHRGAQRAHQQQGQPLHPHQAGAQ